MMLPGNPISAASSPIIHGRETSSSQGNKSRPLPILLCSLVLMFFLGSCNSLKAPEFMNVENIRLAKLGRAESTLLADVRYYNPNKSKLRLKKAKGEAWLDGTYLGEFSVDSLVQIPAESEFRIPVSLKADMSKLLLNSLSVYLNKEVMIRIEGKAKVGKGGLYINYPIKYEGKQDLEKLLNKK